MLNRIRKMREKKGFTLVELIVVIAIIAILTAVIVPLVGRYSAQATYTTLQDNAKTISNSTNTVISDVTMMGSVFGDRVITGTKSNGGTIAITLDGTDVTPSASGTNDQQFAQKLIDALQNALPNDCQFRITTENNTVAGVAYISDTTTTLPTDRSAVGEAGDFNEAYEIASSHTAIGVAGNMIPASGSAEEPDE